ncbi:unnamed protein product, partial [Adineta steineri]
PATITGSNCTINLTNAITLLSLVNVVSSGIYIQYSYNYTALTNLTRLTFSFRMDSASWFLDTVSAIQTGSSTQLINNGDFSFGDNTNWFLCNPYNTTNIGFVKDDPSNTQSGTYYWYDGSKGAADFLYTDFSTIKGFIYTISFYLKSNGGMPNNGRVYIGS